jgi:hypothetical protein
VGDLLVQKAKAIATAGTNTQPWLGNAGSLLGLNTAIPEILEIPAVARNSGVLRSGNSTSGEPYLRGGGEPKADMYVSVCVVLLHVHSQWRLERTKPTPAGRRTTRMVSS